MSMIGRRVANEATPLMTVEGSGTVMFGHGGHHIQVINLTGDTLYVEADRLLAFDGTLQQGTMFMGSQGGVMGMVRGQVTGPGPVHHHPQGPRLGRGDGARRGHRAADHPAAARSTSTRRRTSPTTATSATSSPPRSAGATWWAAARARRSSWS